MLDDKRILSIVSQELNQSAGGNENDFIDANRQAALATYLGQPDGKEVEGRSSVVSTDVADAIEWIMPEVVKSFTKNNEVVTFDPCYDGDEDQAELESQYVYDILMKDNEGFLVIHQFVKDALMQKNGFIKVFYEDDEKTSTQSYTGINIDEYHAVLMEPGVELLERTIDQTIPGMPFFDIKVSITETKKKINVISVPPEEFRVNKMHNSIDVSTARFSAHVMLTTAGELVRSGLKKEFVDTIPSSKTATDDRNYRFYMQGETVSPDGNNSYDPSLREIEIAECYMYMDIDEDGIAEYVKITVSGGDNPDNVIEWEEIDENPFISATAILMSHKLFGLSIYDRLKQIQEQKTSLWRNILDNMYLQNNQRTVVIDGQVNLDDLLVSRPGGIIRAKRVDAVLPYATPPLPSDAYKMMDYLDQVRAGRSGVSPEGPVSDTMIGDRVGSEGVERMLSQKEELVGLMIRVFAETGIKPLCYKIRNQVIKHQDVARDYMFRGQWVKVLPSRWRNRTQTTVRVGTGSGNRREQMSALNAIMMVQDKLQAMPGQILVTPEQTFNVVNDFAKLAGMPSARRYILDPKSPQGMQNAQMVTQSMQQSQAENKEKEMIMLKAQSDIAQAETQKAEAQSQNVQLKAQNEQLKTQVAHSKVESETEIKLLKQQLDEVNTQLKSKTHDDDIEYKYWDSRERYRIEELRILTSAQAKDKSNG
jgi:hypothetical protein